MRSRERRMNAHRIQPYPHGETMVRFVCLCVWMTLCFVFGSLPGPVFAEPFEDEAPEGVLSPMEDDEPIRERRENQPGNASDAEVETGEDDAAAADEPAEPAPVKKRHRRFKDGFSFGTYGRIQASWNDDQQPGDDSNIVSHGARLMQGPYAEFDFKYTVHTDDGFGVRVLATLAFFDEVFHYTGDATQGIAIRNLYAEAKRFIPGVNLKLWVGSRMYRGDDIYLLDFWPLDNLNTLGGGLQWDGYGFRLKWHVGVNRLKKRIPVLYGERSRHLRRR